MIAPRVSTIIHRPYLVCWFVNDSVIISVIFAAHKQVHTGRLYLLSWIHGTLYLLSGIHRQQRQGKRASRIQNYHDSNKEQRKQSRKLLQNYWFSNRMYKETLKRGHFIIFPWPRESLLGKCNDGVRVDRCLAVWAHHRAAPLTYLCVTWEAWSVGHTTELHSLHTSVLYEKHEVWGTPQSCTPYIPLCYMRSMKCGAHHRAAPLTYLCVTWEAWSVGHTTELHSLHTSVLYEKHEVWGTPQSCTPYIPLCYMRSMKCGAHHRAALLTYLCVIWEAWSVGHTTELHSLHTSVLYEKHEVWGIPQSCTPYIPLCYMRSMKCGAHHRAALLTYLCVIWGAWSVGHTTELHSLHTYALHEKHEVWGTPQNCTPYIPLHCMRSMKCRPYGPFSSRKSCRRLASSHAACCTYGV